MQNRSWLMAAAFLLAAPYICRAQDAASSALSKPEAEFEEIVVSATRLPIPEDESPASVTVITARDMELKQIRRVADALREVPGLSIVQTGTPGQLTSLFTRGLGSDQTQVLLDGIPINQGLAGLFNFADLTTDNIDRIEVVRGPQSTGVWTAGLGGSNPDFHKTWERGAHGAIQCGGRVVFHLP